MREVGRVDVAAATELSGLVLARSGVLWTLNDSGDSARVFGLDRRGRLLREVAVTGAEAVDWEDIAARGSTLYAGDIGDNAAQRADIAVYKFAEPGPGVTSVAAERIALHYPDGAHDAETLLVDPRDGTIAIVTKNLSGSSGVYTATRSGALKKRLTLKLGLGQLLTAGDVSADGRTIVLRSYDRAFVWTRKRGETLARALRRTAVHRRREPARRGPGRGARADPRRPRVLHRSRRCAAAAAPLRAGQVTSATGLPEGSRKPMPPSSSGSGANAGALGLTGHAVEVRGVGQHDRRPLEPGRALRGGRAPGALPRVRAEVMVVAAGAEERRLLAQRGHHVEAEHVGVERVRRRHVGDLQVHVAHDRAGRRARRTPRARRRAPDR